MPTSTTPRIALPLALSAALSPALATDATATAASTFSLNRGETITQVCARLQRAGATLSTPDCIREILFANRDWFDRRFGYLWEDPRSVNLDSAVRLWAGVSYVLPAGLAAVTPAPAEAVPPASTAAAESKPIHPGHFDPLGRAPSEFTIELREAMKATLPFEDQRDFEEAKKGFIAAPPYKQIMADAGHVAWDMGSYQWLLDGQDFESINPSLQRQAVLNMAYGLYEVCLLYTSDAADDRTWV